MLANRMRMAAGRPQASLVYTGDSRILANGGGVGSFTFTSVDFGKGGRVVIPVGINALGADFSGMTIGGVAATKRGQANHTATNVTRVAVYEASGVGTSGDVVVSFSVADALSCGIAPFVLTRAAAAIHDSRTATSDPSTLGTGLAVPRRGTALAVVYNNVNNVYGWTGLTERADDGTSTSSGSYASDDFKAAQEALIIEAESGGAPARQAMLALSWGPKL